MLLHQIRVIILPARLQAIISSSELHVLYYRAQLDL